MKAGGEHIASVPVQNADANASLGCVHQIPHLGVRSLFVVFAVVAVVVVITGADFAVDFVEHYADQVGAQALQGSDHCAEGFAAGVAGAGYYGLVREKKTTTTATTPTAAALPPARPMAHTVTDRRHCHRILRHNPL